jgi:hypothetical protein
LNNWSVITVMAGLDAGKRAESSLSRLGFEFYNPLMLDTWITRGRSVSRAAQLFPGYMFCRLLDRWHLLRGSAGVLGVLRDSEGPIPLDASFVAALRASEVDGVHVPSRKPPRFAAGQPVLLTEGAYVDKLVIYDGMAGFERAAVLLTMLGKTTRKFVSVDSLIELEGASAQ